jgi:hypothetical protein
MPRFSNAFNWRKSSADEHHLGETSPEQSSFRVLERNSTFDGKSFDGGARMVNRPGSSMHRHTQSELEPEDNMFAGLNTNRGSGSSNTTKATSTDTSSRHSNISTAPSSADVSSAHDDRGAKRKTAKETTPRPITKSSTSSFLDRAGRTFSFGGQKKNSVPPPNQDSVDSPPPIPTFQREDEYGRTRAFTASTTSTATPPKLEEGSQLDMGGDFGSMFTRFDKRASQITLRNDGSPGHHPQGQRQGQPPHLNLDTTTSIEQPPASWNSQNSRDGLMDPGPLPTGFERPPPVPRHQPSFEYRSTASPEGIVEDEDAKLLADSVAAGRFLTDSPDDNIQTSRYRRNQDQFAAAPRTFTSTYDKDDNMFAGAAPRIPRPTLAGSTQNSSSATNKVMTPAEFERYRLDKEREGLNKAANPSTVNGDDDEDEINYDDEEDEEEKLKQQAKQRRHQQASMSAYRQRNMKTTGELRSTSPLPSARPILPSSLSAPHLGQAKTPSPEPARANLAEDDDEDDDVPLAILQAHGFPNKIRQPSRLSSVASNPNLRASMHMSAGRPMSTLGEPAGNGTKRHSTLPAFARNLPQDPFVGASIARPAMRESLAFGGGSPAHLTPPVHHTQQAPAQPGGLVGVIANEERSRAMRRGSPNMESQKLMGAGGNIDPINGIPPHMMYGGGHMGMGANATGMSRPPHQLSVSDQAQLQMTQQMSQFMQMQMQFMQMMAGNQQGSPQQTMPPQLPPMMPGMPPQMPHPPYGGLAAPPSVADFSSGQSVMGVPVAQPRRMDPGMRTMSMIQPTTSSPFLQSGFAGAPGPATPMGYTPSIAPSERSNVGLPGRYRPVSQAGSVSSQALHPRSRSMSGALTLSLADDSKSKSTIRLINTAKAGSDDDDDDEGWESMRAKRDQKKSTWRFKKRTEDVYQI